MNEYKILFGDIYGHSGLSPDVPNLFSPERYYRYARDIESFDI